MAPSNPPPPNLPHPQPQHYEPIPTLEPIDPEGMVQGLEGHAELLHRLDPDVPPPSSEPFQSTQQDDGEDDRGLVDRESSSDWKRQREQSRVGRHWWKRPSPYWLLLIQLGQAVSMGMGMAPKSEIYNSLACMIHYPSTKSELPGIPIDSNPPQIPTMPTHPLPSDPSQEESSFASNELAVTFLAASVQSAHPHQSISHRLSTLIGLHSNTSMSAPHEIGGVLIDPIKCRKSPEVQSAAATFTTIMSITQGVLAALTTGWWGKASDKWGRTRVLATAMFGIIVSDIVFLTTAKFPLRVPGAYRFLIVGPIFDGLMGGSPTSGAVCNAYIADCTPDGTRAQIFSRYMGIMMLGFAIGPILGTAVIRQTGDVLSVFYFSTVLHIMVLFIVLFILPESLSASAKSFLSHAAAERKKTEQDRLLAERAWEELDDDAAPAAGASGWSRLSGVGEMSFVGRKSRGNLRRAWRRAFSFLEPLELFLPRVDENDPLGRKNWNLTLLAIGYGLVSLAVGVFPLKFAYMQLAFGWGPSELGPIMTLIGSIRGAHLLVFLPTIVRYCKPKHPSPQPSTTLSDEGDLSSTPATTGRSGHALHDSKFDLIILRSSLFIDIIAYNLIILSVSGTTFLMATSLACLGGGAGPAMSSLALALVPSAKHSGRLFGGLAVMQACFSTVLGPLIFGLTYSYTTKTYPKTIFACALVLLIGAFTSFAIIRLEPKKAHAEAAANVATVLEDEEEDLCKLAGEPRRERGRDRKVKNVSSFSRSSTSS